MSKILELYSSILESKQRFVDEVFDTEIYKPAIPQLTIIDLGAYEGEFSFYCYNFAKKIYSIEPDPRPYAILEKRVKDYELDKIKCFPIALGSGTGERLFHASGYGGSRLLDGVITNAKGDDIKVNTMSLAQFMKQEKIDKVDILKVDIENGEEEVFKADDFKNVAYDIDVIIGEHLEPVRSLLEGFDFVSKDVGNNNILFGNNSILFKE